MRAIGFNDSISEIGRMMCGDYTAVAYAVMMTVLAFNMARIEFAAAFYPCALAFIAAALKKNTVNLYLVFPVLAGFLSLMPWKNSAVHVLGDMAAVVLCTTIFMLPQRRRFSDFMRMMVCAAAIVICNVMYYALARMIYRLDALDIAFEVVSVCVLYYIFHVFFLFSDFRGAYSWHPESGIVSFGAVWTLTFCGIGSAAPAGAAECIAAAASLFAIIEVGYRLGVFAGLAASSVSGLVLYVCGLVLPSHVVIYICAGLTAGLFRGLNKYTAASCFAAVCLIFRLVCTGSMGALPSLPPLAASLIFVLLPRKISVLAALLLRRIVHEEIRTDDVRADDISRVLAGYKSCFSQLARLYSIGCDKRSIVSHQFKGMEQVVDKLEKDVKIAAANSLLPLAPIGAKYRIDTASSGCARIGDVSGDSYICRKLDDSKYVMILCDGMGKGEGAAIESNLAVKTLSNLIEAGFETELALHTLNSILLLKSQDEVFSTVDIGIFDTVNGRLKLYKIGAASTFIKRNGKVDVVKMAALPMGIVDGLKIDYVNIKLQEGDQIIMVSDGVTDSGRYADKNAAPVQGRDIGTEWLSSLIMSVRSKDPATMADLIINKTIENYGLRERDDITVISAIVRTK